MPLKVKYREYVPQISKLNKVALILVLLWICFFFVLDRFLSSRESSLIYA